MEVILQRLCWNTSGWRKPTGSSDEKGYPTEMGFGMEEWNFQLQDACNGFVHGYIGFQKAAASFLKRAGGSVNIYFWALHPETRDFLLVGAYYKARKTSDADWDYLERFFRSEKILERRVLETRAIVPTLSEEDIREEILYHIENGLFNFKCPTQQVEIFQHPIRLPKKISGKNVAPRFGMATYVEERVIQEILKTTQEEEGQREYQSQLAEDGYYRETSTALKMILRRHAMLSNQFCNWVSSKGAIRVRQEKSQVDVSFSASNLVFLAELKVCYGVGTTKAIREALGQLLEYNYYGHRFPADKWLIVLDQEPSTGDKVFIQRINNELRLPVTLGWKSKEGFHFSEPVF